MNAKYGLQAIRRQRLKIARITELNDPFEFLQVASSDPRTRARYQYVKRALSEYMGLLCFSESWRNPVQWSHYAQSHRGVCLGFDVAPSTDIRKVRYVANRISPNLRAMREDGPAAFAHMLELLTLKFEHWHYEQEHRLFVRLADEDKSGMYFFSFAGSPDVKLSEVSWEPTRRFRPSRSSKHSADEVLRSRLTRRGWHLGHSRWSHSEIRIYGDRAENESVCVSPLSKR